MVIKYQISSLDFINLLGKSKKEAKLACSQKAIETICGLRISETRTVAEKSNPRAHCDLDDWMELEGKNPVSILNELYPGIQYRKFILWFVV